jgi:hypothetical protein
MSLLPTSARQTAKQLPCVPDGETSLCVLKDLPLGRNPLLTDWLVYYMQFSFLVKSFARPIFYFVSVSLPDLSDMFSFLTAGGIICI